MPRLGSGWKSALAGLSVLVFNAVCHAQSCALCYTQAANSGHKMIAALRSGILVLIIPPMFMSMGITWLAYKKRNQTNDKDSPDRSRDSW